MREKPAAGARRKSPEAAAREARLAEALRANLSKRKSQQRLRRAVEPDDNTPREAGGRGGSEGTPEGQ